MPTDNEENTGDGRMDVGAMRKEKILKEIMEWGSVILTAVVISMFLNFCILVNARVPSASMENTIMTGDRLFGSRLSYAFSEPERGDVVIFHFPDNEKILYIKRIIGLPGETVEIKDGGVYINNVLLEEKYLNVTTMGEFGPYEVPEDHYFMLGDNRNNSADSRFWDNTYLERSKIVGKAVIRYFPNPGLIKHGDYDQ
ncbi:MAG: signal peptidase I [Lachnospiraceae bacterium]|nr:signal peptidase I [Lachnospiraceae bacterium]